MIIPQVPTQAIEEARICPFCPQWTIDEEDYNLINPEYLIGQSEIAGIACCEACNLAIGYLPDAEQVAMIALARAEAAHG